MAQFPANLGPVADPSELLRLTLEHFQAETGTIHVLEGDGVLHLKAVIGNVPPPVLEAVRVVPVGKGLAGLAVERAEPVTVCNLQTDTSGQAKPGARATGVQGSICVPMMVEGRAVGALGIGTYRERTFSEEEVALLLETGRHMGRKLWNL
ncbi:MAG: GAF domain-containing protein [Acidobacteria bacterium]|nr:GAF domain-containing protein [Acidobacteriota bacterium]